MTERDDPSSASEGAGPSSDDLAPGGDAFPGARGAADNPAAGTHDLEGGIRPRFQEQAGEPTGWEWRDRNSTGHQVLIVTRWTAGFIAVTTLLAWLLSDTTDCSSRSGLTCYLGGVVLATIFPLASVPILAKILRDRGIERPMAVVITTGVILSAVTFVDRFVFRNQAFLGHALPWWIDLPIVVTISSAVATAFVTSHNRYV